MRFVRDRELGQVSGWLVALALCGAVAAAGSTAAASEPPAADLDEAALARISAAWREDWVLTYSSNEPAYPFPNEFDSGQDERDATGSYVDPHIPSWFIHLSSIPFRGDGRIVRAYLGCVRSYDQHHCSEWELRINVYDPSTRAATFVGSIQAVSCTGNSGAHLIPFAVTADDSNLILDAWMGDPGAGGSSVDYGYAMIPLQQADPAEPSLTGFCGRFIATRRAVFYDSFGKVLYVTSSERTPSYSDGERNAGAVVYRDLVDGTRRTVLEEPDSGYRIGAVDESARTVTIEVTQYTYDESCPRQVDALDCADSSVSERTIPLP